MMPSYIARPQVIHHDNALSQKTEAVIFPSEETLLNFLGGCPDRS